ncbi:TetR/AcrR family transcriptional regulator [Paenibacillus sp. GCM10012307]|uniref:TetR/AcrR family transcriptional regulator n=1 Tax=Paenibacillus roseus TaxID=2798579 RepID=A0A934MRY0_9BACL|nr:TetR/AcrR family transcriptional regulator [Paenibacillus roseus]MBJ6362769.1 TetR/AcrR family transcriptional regulator [Paenibacillus roseus]
MPYPKGHMEKVRGHIIQSAAKAFRTNGIRDISVPAIMKGAGLTHGGFYSHFDNKDHLVMETCQYAINDTISLLQKAVDQEGQDAKIHSVIHFYLSSYHRDQMEIGCILPSLSGEMIRMSEEVRSAFTQEVQRMIDFFCQLADINHSKGSALLSLLVGTIILARSVHDPELSDRLLASGKQQAFALLES